jgi:hypothetical protein
VYVLNRYSINLVYCMDLAILYIDIYRMARSPNCANGKLLKDLSIKYDLTDPLRIINPNKRVFSYSPFGTIRKKNLV